MTERARLLGSGSPATAGNRGTLPFPSTITGPAPRFDFRELFVRHYRHLKAWYQQLSGAGVGVTALSRERLEATAWLPAKREGVSTAIIGRHPSCRLHLGADPFVSLRHLVAVVHPRKEDEQVRFRLVDLRTSMGFTLEDGRRLEALEAEGPVLVRVGIYAVLLFPTGDGAPAWPEDPQAGWRMIPERVYSHERPAEHRGWDGREVPNRRGGEDEGSKSTLVRLMAGLRPARRNLVGPGEEARGELVIGSSEGETRVVVGSRALRQGVLFGRHDRCDNRGLPVLGDPRISRVHLLVVEIAGEVHAIDTASKNGLMAGSQLVSGVCLSGRRTVHLSGGLATLEWKPIRRPVGDLQSRVSRNSSLDLGCPPSNEHPVDRPCPAPADERRIRVLYEAGLCLQAYHLARQYHPLHAWRGTSAMILAGRLAMNLGSPRLGYALHLRAARTDGRRPEARYWAARALLDRQGAAAAWAWMRPRGETGDAALEARADWLGLKATIAARFRDFESAEALLHRAFGLAPGRPGTWVERAIVLEGQDRFAEALEAAREGLRLRPRYRRGVQVVAHLLLVLGRDDEARELLFQSATLIESGAVAGQLAALLAEQGRLREALEWLDRFEALSPLLDRAGRGWLAAKRSDALYGLGDLHGARRQAVLAANPFHAAVARRLAARALDTRRVLLPVPFVKQHHRTCTPATLASLSAFWGRPLDQSAVARAICYDGTPQHRARTWAQQNGWVVREFRVTWASARTLLDRGIPFALSTAGAMGGHEQAVVGYDAHRGTLYARDPGQPFLVEVLAEPLLEEQKWNGPSGLVFLPPEHAERLAGLELPDGDAYDLLQALQLALLAHRRYEAGAIERRMARVFSENVLALRARELLAAYDSDPARLLQSIEDSLGRFPDAPSLLFWRLSLLQNLAPPAEYVRILGEACERHPRDVALLSRLAHTLSADARERARARRLLRTLARVAHRPTQALDLLSHASILETEGRRDEALELGRFAACFEDMNEGYARTYFRAARSRGRPDEALAHLRRRFDVHGREASGPGQTLFWALESLGRRSEAFLVLERALSLRPCDPELMLFAAEAYAARRRLDRAHELLAAARGRARHATWLRTAAAVAAGRGDRAEALRSWREVLAVEPWAVDGHRAVAGILAETEGSATAVAHLRAAFARFPRHHLLFKLCAEWEGRTERAGPDRTRPDAKRHRRPAAPGSETSAVVPSLLAVLSLLLVQVLSRFCS
jgi:tetratricopeptide (TPR) repeat protein